MNWIKLSDRPPAIHHCYHWKTTVGGGFSYYDSNGFCFHSDKDLDTPDEEIFWLDEMAPDVELTINELKDLQAFMLEKQTFTAMTLVELIHKRIANNIKELEHNHL